MKSRHARRIQVLVVILAASASALHAQTYKALHTYSINSGGYSGIVPAGLMSQGQDGNLYSTATSTPLGACSYCGAAFSISPSGVLTVYDFKTTGMGYTPFSGVSLGIDGNFYGTTKAGGTFNAGTIFQLTSSGTLATLYNFGTCQYPCVDGYIPNSPPVQGADGNFYGTTPHSADGTNDGIAYQITSAGKYKILHVFSLSSGGYNPDAPFIQGTDGSFYGTTFFGGATTLSNVVVSSGNPNAFAAASNVLEIESGGTSPNPVTVAFNYTINDSGCPGCIDQLQVGLNTDPSPQTYAYNGGSFATGSASVNISVPNTPGRYYIAIDFAEDYGFLFSAAYWANGQPTATRYIGVIDVW